MRNTITVSGSGGQTLVTANDGSNILKVNDTSYDTAWLNSASYTVTISSSYHVYISNDFAGESGNFYLVLDHIDTSAQYHVDYYYNVAKYGTKYVFGEKNEKFNLEGAISKSQAINTLKTNFQAGVDAIYSAEAAQHVSGVPTASTPQALATGVGTIATTKYNTGKSDGVTEGKAAVQTDTLSIHAIAQYIDGTIQLAIRIDNESLSGITLYENGVTVSGNTAQINENKSAKHSFTGRISQIY